MLRDFGKNEGITFLFAASISSRVMSKWALSLAALALSNSDGSLRGGSVFASFNPTEMVNVTRMTNQSPNTLLVKFNRIIRTLCLGVFV